MHKSSMLNYPLYHAKFNSNNVIQRIEHYEQGNVLRIIRANFDILLSLIAIKALAQINIHPEASTKYYATQRSFHSLCVVSVKTFEFSK